MAVFSGVFAGAAFDTEELALLRSVCDAACADLGIAGNELERREHIALLILEVASGGEMDGEVLRRRAVELANGARA